MLQERLRDESRLFINRARLDRRAVGKRGKVAAEGAGATHRYGVRDEHRISRADAAARIDYRRIREIEHALEARAAGRDGILVSAGVAWRVAEARRENTHIAILEEEDS